MRAAVSPVPEEEKSCFLRSSVSDNLVCRMRRSRGHASLTCLVSSAISQTLASSGLGSSFQYRSLVAEETKLAEHTVQVCSRQEGCEMNLYHTAHSAQHLQGVPALWVKNNLGAVKIFRSASRVESRDGVASSKAHRVRWNARLLELADPPRLSWSCRIPDHGRMQSGIRPSSASAKQPYRAAAIQKTCSLDGHLLMRASWPSSQSVDRPFGQSAIPILRTFGNSALDQSSGWSPDVTRESRRHTTCANPATQSRTEPPQQQRRSVRTVRRCHT